MIVSPCSSLITPLIVFPASPSVLVSLFVVTSLLFSGASCVSAIIRQKHIHLISTPTLNQEAIANFMENGRYENHLRKLRHELHSNSLHLAQAITDYFPEDTKIITPQGGFMLWVELNKKIDTTELYYKAMQHKISIAPGRMFTLHDQYRNCMRLSFGQQWSAFIEERLQVLGNIIKESF